MVSAASTSRPFGFDTEFGDEGSVLRQAPPTPERRKRVYLAAEVEQIRQAAFAEGEASTVARAQQAQTLALNEIGEAARQGLSALARIAVEHKSGSADLALAAARKIAGAAIERFPEAPIRAAIEALAREIETQPRLVVRSADDSEAFREAVELTARDGGFNGQIVFRVEPGPLAAFALEWGDGKAAFDPDAAEQRIAEAFEAALAAEGLHGESLNPGPGAA